MDDEPASYAEIALTSSVIDVEEHKGIRGGPGHWEPFAGLTDVVIDHISARDTCYLSTVSETGWPYVQHRGGERGFVRILDSHTIGWVERHGNRQYISAGNVNAVDRVAMIFVDYPNRIRLKLYGHATYHPDPSAELLAELDAGPTRADGAVTVHVAAVDWNCPKYITPRYTVEEIRELREAHAPTLP